MFSIRVKQGEGRAVKVNVQRDNVTVAEVLEAAHVHMDKQKKASDAHGRSLSLDTLVAPDMEFIMVSNAPKDGQ